MKHQAPQFDLPVAGRVFNLATETTQDGARIAREREAASQAAADAKARDAHQQQRLFPNDP